MAVGLAAALSAALYSTFFSISGASSRAGKTVDSYIEAGYFLDRFSREARSSYYRRTNAPAFFNGRAASGATAATFPSPRSPRGW